MKANEAPKSKFVFPDKLYARCKDNKTIDMSYAPQNMEAVEYLRTDAFIEKALAYLNDKFYFNNVFYGIVSTDFNAMEELFDDFRTYMEGE
jgi:hypothetical protein